MTCHGVIHDATFRYHTRAARQIEWRRLAPGVFEFARPPIIDGLDRERLPTLLGSGTRHAGRISAFQKLALLKMQLRRAWRPDSPNTKHSFSRTRPEFESCHDIQLPYVW